VEAKNSEKGQQSPDQSLPLSPLYRQPRYRESRYCPKLHRRRRHTPFLAALVLVGSAHLLAVRCHISPHLQRYLD
jgi:hypothetical protein